MGFQKEYMTSTRGYIRAGQDRDAWTKASGIWASDRFYVMIFYDDIGIWFLPGSTF